MQNWDKSLLAIHGMLEVFNLRRLLLLEGLQSIDGIECPRAQGAFYLFPNIEALGLTANDFTAKILRDEKVALVPGEGFGAPGCVRLSYAISDSMIEKGIERIARFCKGLK